ncbi:hypothetical protein HU200_016112 [Digitaria exilis]|uniref:Uncharacterized protein n=1 Tax=Digitaria exilis TaxID=1010633 RepID=A0A835KJ47_9POAL|nr:hypothetical protein HU200_016112 [Digitaria exilis]
MFRERQREVLRFLPSGRFGKRGTQESSGTKGSRSRLL